MRRASRKRYIGILGFIFFSCVVNGQDIEFSQFYSNRLYLNPAFAGSEKTSAVTMNYRNQWPQINRPFVTYSVSFDRHIDFINGGLGVQLIQDNQGRGAIKTTTVSGVYAHTFKINNKLSVRAGMKTSFVQRQLNWSSFIFSDMIDPMYGVIYPTREVQPIDLGKNYLDFSTGFIVSHQKYFLGFIVDHLAKPDESFKSASEYTRLPRKYTAHFGTTFSLRKSSELMGKNITLSPNLLYRQQQGFQQMNYGCYLSKNNWVAGLWFRQNLSFDFDAFIVLFGYETDWFRVGYSYDYVVSKLIKTRSGAHELSVSIFLKSDRIKCDDRRPRIKKKPVRAVKCPKI